MRAVSEPNESNDLDIKPRCRYGFDRVEACRLRCWSHFYAKSMLPGSFAADGMCVAAVGARRERDVAGRQHAVPRAGPSAADPRKELRRPAQPELDFRVNQIKDKLAGDNPQIGLKPFTKVLSSPDPEIFRMGLNHIYLTDTLVKQCDTDALLAAALANELGKMISEREKSVADQIRAPEPLLPPSVPIGGMGNSREADPTRYVEMAFFEKEHPKTPRKLTPVNPQVVARSILEKAGFQRTDLDAALPILQNAERNSVHANQFNGPAKQSDWKAPN